MLVLYLTSFQTVHLGHSYYYIVPDRKPCAPVLSGFELSALGPHIYFTPHQLVNSTRDLNIRLLLLQNIPTSWQSPYFSLDTFREDTYAKILHKNFILEFQTFLDSANQNSVLSFSVTYSGNHIKLANHLIIRTI